MELPKRQIEELQSMSRNLEQTDNFDMEIERFSKFAEELKEFVRKNASNKKVADQVNAMPVIDYKKSQTTVANTFIRFLNNEKKKEKAKAIEAANEIASKFGRVMWHWYEQ